MAEEAVVSWIDMTEVKPCFRSQAIFTYDEKINFRRGYVTRDCISIDIEGNGCIVLSVEAFRLVNAMIERHAPNNPLNRTAGEAGAEPDTTQTPAAG